jgi:hypothetical protein
MTGGTNGMELHKIWIEQCEAAKGIEDECGTDKALIRHCAADLAEG